MPTNVRPTVHFDMHAESYRGSWIEQADEIRGSAPVAWSESYDGFWVLSRYADIMSVARDWRTFSSHHDLPGGDAFTERERRTMPQVDFRRKGVTIPESTTVRLVPTEADPPLQTAVRKLEARLFSPAEVGRKEEQARRYALEQITCAMPSGRIDFATTYAVPVPTKIALSLVGFDVENEEWESFARVAHALSSTPEDSPDYPLEEMMAGLARVLDLVHRRKEEPQHDVASALVHGEALGEPIEPEQAAQILHALVFGGADTTASVLLHSLLWLDENREARARLASDPALIPRAVDEFSRFFPSVHGIARTAMDDVEIGGQRIAAGDRVYLWFAAGNRDPDKFEKPHEVRLDRENAWQHLTFSAGPHRCLGAEVARVELRVMLATLLERLPDFEVERDNVVRYEKIGGIDGFRSLPARFHPSAEPVAL